MHSRDYFGVGFVSAAYTAPCQRGGEGRGGAWRDGTGLNRGVTSFKNSTLHHSNRYSSSVGERAGGLGGCETCLTTEINNGTEWKHIGIQRKKDRGKKINSHWATAS